MITSEIIEKYSCRDYVNGEYSAGYYDEDSYLQLILPVIKAKVSNQGGHLTIGHAGADGIEFCFQKGKSGVWAYYPYANEYDLKANNVAELVAGWRNGSISV